MTNFLTVVKKSDTKPKNVIQIKKALKRMGIVNNYEDIRNKTVAVVGVGGVGSGKNYFHNL